MNIVVFRHFCTCPPITPYVRFKKGTTTVPLLEPFILYQVRVEITSLQLEKFENFICDDFGSRYFACPQLRPKWILG